MEGTVKQDCGAYIRDGMKTLCNDGICTEPSWPYIIRKFSKKPDNICYEEAVNYKILSYNRVQGQNQIKQCLAQGNCIVAGIWVYESFESQEVASTGMVPMPESTEKNLGGHAVLIVGYDDTVQRFKLRNSWGNGWGDKGYFYIPYLVFDKLVMDMWTASDIA